MIETKRVYLRPWQKDDASDLFLYAKSPLVGPQAGWPVHTSVSNSEWIIENVLSTPYTYAIVLKETDRIIGSYSIMFKDRSNIKIDDNEVELGFWIGEPYWGQGIIKEVTQSVLDFCFNILKCNNVWCGYYEGNIKSMRVQEKCGFRYHHNELKKDCLCEPKERMLIVNILTKEDYMRENK